MNNATLALNVSRPAAPATPASPAATGREQDDAPSPKRFDAALDAAHADTRDANTQSQQPAATNDTAAPAKAAADANKNEPSADDDTTKKADDKGDGDTSIAATMLSLIGVPPTLTDVASKALGAVKTMGSAVGDALGASVGLAGVLPGASAGLAGVLPGASAAADGLAGLKDAALASAGLAGSAGTADAGAATVAASPFATLLAAQGGEIVAAKDSTSPAVDAGNVSPMPLLHAQNLAQGVPVVQVQATQAATSPQFAQELGEQIAWMGSGQVKEARIKLHPEELGSMDVRVNLDGGKVNVAILAQHPAAVHAVQQTLSQLDSMLAHHGLSLGQADVGQRQAEQGGEGSASGANAQQGESDAAGAPGAVATSPVSRGLLDEIA